MTARLSALRTKRPLFSRRKISGTHFCWRLSRLQNPYAAGSIGFVDKSSDTVTQICTHPVCSTVRQSTALPRAPMPSAYRLFFSPTVKVPDRGAVYLLPCNAEDENIWRMPSSRIPRSTSVLTRATRRNSPEDIILHSHRRKNLVSYTEYLEFNPHSHRYCFMSVFKWRDNRMCLMSFTVDYCMDMQSRSRWQTQFLTRPRPPPPPVSASLLIAGAVGFVLILRCP
jgi:hypothetical protein